VHPGVKVGAVLLRRDEADRLAPDDGHSPLDVIFPQTPE
jgi:hypothetical protein